MSSINSLARFSRPRSGMRYARNVGRVGALAVALGVGLAVGSTPAIANADETPSATSDDQKPPPTASGETAKSGAESRQERRAERRRTLRAVIGNSRTQVSAPGGDHRTPSSNDGNDG